MILQESPFSRVKFWVWDYIGNHLHIVGSKSLWGPLDPLDMKACISRLTQVVLKHVYSLWKPAFPECHQNTPGTCKLASMWVSYAVHLVLVFSAWYRFSPNSVLAFILIFLWTQDLAKMEGLKILWLDVHSCMMIFQRPYGCEFIFVSLEKAAQARGILDRPLGELDSCACDRRQRLMALQWSIIEWWSALSCGLALRRLQYKYCNLC